MPNNIRDFFGKYGTGGFGAGGQLTRDKFESIIKKYDTQAGGANGAVLARADGVLNTEELRNLQDSEGIDLSYFAGDTGNDYNKPCTFGERYAKSECIFVSMTDEHIRTSIADMTRYIFGNKTALNYQSFEKELDKQSKFYTYYTKWLDHN